MTSLSSSSSRNLLTFRSAKTPNQPSGDGATSYPKRRILQSLVPEKPPAGRPQDALLSAGASNPMSRAQKPPSVRPIKGKNQTSTSPRILEASSDLTAQLADRSSVGSGRSSASPRGPALAAPARGLACARRYERHLRSNQVPQNVRKTRSPV